MLVVENSNQRCSTIVDRFSGDFRVPPDWLAHAVRVEARASETTTMARAMLRSAEY